MINANTKFVSLGAILLFSLVTACGDNEDRQAADRLVSVNATVISLTDERLVKSYTGSLEGEKQAVIYARIAEAVEEVRVKEGESVRANQVLISLDKTGASSRYLETQSLYLNAEKNFKKMEYLYREGAVSETQYDLARTNYEVTRATFEAATKLVDIQSPISGVVTSLDVSDGEFLSIGRKLATVATVDRLRVKFAVNAEDIRFFSQGAHVSVTAGNGRVSGSGAVTSISESADPETRAFQVEVLVDNEDGRFKVGTFARVDVALESMDNIIVVPRDALMILDGQPVGYVVNNGQVEKRVLSPGTNLEGRVVIDSGLAIGDTLVTLGQSYLSDGVKVTIANLE